MDEWDAATVSEWLIGLVDHDGKKLVTGDFPPVDGRLLLFLLDDDKALSCICRGDAVQRATLRLKIMDQHSVQKVRGSGSVLYRIPVVNIFHDLLFDNEPPSRASAEAFFNLCGLVASLFMGIAMALPAAVGFDEARAVKARFDGPVYGKYASGEKILSEFAVYSGVAVYSLAAALLGTVVTLVFEAGSGTRIGRDAGPHKSPQVKEATRAYWRWARWSLLWTFSNVVIGISLVLMAFNRLVTLKFPDFHLEQNGGVAWLNPKSFFGFYRGLALAYGFICSRQRASFSSSGAVSGPLHAACVIPWTASHLTVLTVRWLQSKIRHIARPRAA